MDISIVTRAGEAISKVVGPSMKVVRKYLPEGLLVLGGAGVIGGTVLACKATLETQDVAENVKDELADIPDDDEEKGKKKTKVLLRAGGQYLKAYAPAIGCMSAGLTAIGASHGILRNRIAAVGAAYAALETAYSNYRGRVIEEHGEEVDRKYRLGIFDEKVTETKTLKNGKEKLITRVDEAVHADGTQYSPYSRYFDEFNSNEWSKNQGENWDFLRIAQSIANEKYDRQGYLFLNDVYELLGFEKVPEGQLVGWIKGVGDDFIDFGLYEARNALARDYVNGGGAIFVLDFNCDGLMWDLI